MSLSAFSYARDTDGNWPQAEGARVKGWPVPYVPGPPPPGNPLPLGGQNRTTVGGQVTMRAHWPGQHSPAGPPMRPCYHVHLQLSHLTGRPSPLEHLHLPPLPTPPLPLIVFFLSLSLVSFSVTVSAFVSLCPVSPCHSLCISSVSVPPCPSFPHPICPSLQSSRRVDWSRAEALGPWTAWTPIPLCHLLAV